VSTQQDAATAPQQFIRFLTFLHTDTVFFALFGKNSSRELVIRPSSTRGCSALS
jgi:hypothetical protein